MSDSITNGNRLLLIGTTVYGDIHQKIIVGETWSRKSTIYGFPSNVKLKNIIGRKPCSKHVLEQLKEHKKIAIIGSSGIGKTAFAGYCAKTGLEGRVIFFSKYFHISVYLNCETMETFTKCVNSLAIALGIPFSNDRYQLLVKVFNVLNLKKTLIIFDNINDSEIVGDYMLGDYKQLYFLAITDSCMLEDYFLCYSLEELDNGNCGKIIRNFFNVHGKTIPWKKKHAELISTLTGNPLGLINACVTIKNEYDKLTKVKDILIKYTEDCLSGDSLESRVQFAIQKNFNQIQNRYKNNEEKRKIFETITNTIAFISPDRIQITIFENTIKMYGYKSEYVDNIVNCLVNFSFLTEYEEKQTLTKVRYFSIHRLTQRVIRKQIENKNFLNTIFDTIQILGEEYVDYHEDYLTLHINQYSIFNGIDTYEWRNICKCMFKTPQIVCVVDKIVDVLNNTNYEEKEQYLRILFEELFNAGHLEAYRVLREKGLIQNEFLLDTSIKQTISIWNEQLYYLQTFNSTNQGMFRTQNWIDIYWYAWFGWTDKLKKKKETDVERLLQPGCDNMTVLHISSITGNIDIINLFSEIQIRELNSFRTTYKQLTPVMIAAKYWKYNYLKELFEYVNTKEELQKCDIDDLKETIRILINHGVPIDKTDENGRTAIFWASHYKENINSQEIFELLRENGATEPIRVVHQR